MQKISITPSGRHATPSSPDLKAFLSLGFRPLYIAGSAWALISVAIWIFWPALIPTPFNGLSWHAHEMLWGFIATIAVGFLLTASATWTKHNPLKGSGLALVTLLWALARIGYITGGTTLFWLAAAAETAFFAISAVCLMRVMVLGKSRRNYGLPLLVAGLGIANVLYLQAVLARNYPLLIERFNVGMICMAVIVLLIGRRVIPFFTMRMVPGLQIPMLVRSGHYQLTFSALAIGFGLLQLDVLTAISLALAGLIALWQSLQWKPLSVLHKPMLWILHLGYIATGVGLLLAAAQLGGLASGVAMRPAFYVHVIGMGGFSVLIIGMVTRTALGHLGRPLALDTSMLVSYYFMIAAVVFRLAALWPTGLSKALLDASALSWVVCMALYLWRFIPMLVRPRY
ncbi:MAG TPA: NnrS family protein [Burkholderiaceae bacterium]|nr:NnrS family protein [Burkholderiaceae bacterium]